MNLKLLALLFMVFASLAVGQTKPRQATLAQQKMCADQARRAFKESYTSEYDGISYDYTIHYDALANICYIMVHGGGVSKSSKSPVVSNLVFDAFEGRVYATYTWINSEHKKYWEVAPMECSVLPRGREMVTCKTAPEFEYLVDKYFGIGR